MKRKVRENKKSISNSTTKVNISENDIENNIPDIFDLFVPECIEENKNHVYLGKETYLRTYSISTYPRELYVGFLDEFFKLGNTRISMYIENIPDNVIISVLNKKVVALKTQIILKTKSGATNDIPVYQTAIADLESVMEAIQTNQEKMFIVNIFITIYAKSLEELESKCWEFESICAKKALYPRSLIYRQNKGLLSILPLGTREIRDFDRNLTTGAAACLIPVTGSNISHSSGIYLGQNLYTGSPVFFDRFIGPPQLPTQHVYVAGKSGGGKSVTLKLFTARSVVNGIKTVVFDPEREYQKVIKELLGGEYITIRPGMKSGINIMDIDEEIEEDGEYIVDIYSKISSIRALLSSFLRNFAGRPLTPIEITSLEEAIKEIYAEKGINSKAESLYEEGGIEVEGKYRIGKVKKDMPTLSTLHEKLKNKSSCAELYELMKPLVGDGSLSMFDCKTTIDLHKSIVTGFDLKEIRDEFTKFLSTLVIFDFVWTKFVQKDKQKKSVILDEAWMFVKYPESAAYLEQIARRGRKYKASLVIATQNIEEFISREEGRAIINACSTMFLLLQNPSVSRDIVKEFNLSEGCANLLETFSPGEAIMLLNGNASAIRIMPTSFEWEYIQT